MEGGVDRTRKAREIACYRTDRLGGETIHHLGGRIGKRIQRRGHRTFIAGLCEIDEAVLQRHQHHAVRLVIECEPGAGCFFRDHRELARDAVGGDD